MTDLQRLHAASVDERTAFSARHKLCFQLQMWISSTQFNTFVLPCLPLLPSPCLACAEQVLLHAGDRKPK